MNQPLPIADKVGVGGGDCEIVHGLGVVDKGDGLNKARLSLPIADGVAYL
jgi:hypothetical protein